MLLRRGSQPGLAPVPFRCLLIRVRNRQHARFAKGWPADLEPDRQPALGESAGHADRRDAVHIEGQRIAEQILFRPRTNAIQVLTRSADDSLLTFDENGGVKEVPIEGDRVVLTDDVIRRLVRAATAIKRVFRERDQDIEWAYMKGQIYIVQSRPFIPGG